MDKVVGLQEAVSGLVNDGDSVALEGFTHLIPTAAAHEIIRQKRRRLTLIRMTPDLIYDQMIGMGCADEDSRGKEGGSGMTPFIYNTPPRRVVFKAGPSREQLERRT